MEPRAKINVERAQQAMANWAIGHTLLYASEATSTMELARQMNPASGTIITVEEQHTGRGRLGRTWQAPWGAGLLCTIVLRPPLLPPEPGMIIMAAGLAVVDAIAAVAPALAARLVLKWPNDVLIAGEPGAGKTAGLLLEAAYRETRQEEVLLGMGVNVSQTAAELPPPSPRVTPATSLLLAGAGEIDRTDLLIALCRALTLHLDESRSRGDALFAAWRARLQTLTQMVQVTQPGQGVLTSGRAVDVARDGSLIIQQADGTQMTIASGDVSLRRETT
ncbi:MAG: biotin--[acetyl-CoA-carboxylase] ligase [Caldilineaceae bacterium]|nr:biotin--[acetyl-CoA-carboxylase] ligase [Caldilineaceae bacterium]